MEGATYGEYEKKKKMTTQDSFPTDANMIDIEEKTESEVVEDSWMKQMG